MTILNKIKGVDSNFLNQLRNHMGAGSDGHGYDHVMRVYQTAMKIAADEECDLTSVALTALLHDADDGKLFNTTNNANARMLMASIGTNPDTIEKVCQAINEISYSHNKGKRPSTIEGAIVQDADRLDAIGAIGIARAFAYGGSRGNTLDATVRHFVDKLLKLKDSMNTSAGKLMAERRHQYMVDFLSELSYEEGGDIKGA